MASTNGSASPFLISGGGIGGLVCAYALAQKGFPVRLFEQSSEFREVGAGIQLGPNIFRVLEKIGLKDAILADAHVPPAQEMRDALTGKLITRIPLDAEFSKRFGGQPYAVTHRADIHGTFLKACQGSNLIALENSRRVTGYEARADGVTALLDDGGRADGRALMRALRVAGHEEGLFVEQVAELPQAILQMAKDGDVVVTMGAGSIGGVPAQVRQLAGGAA